MWKDYVNHVQFHFVWIYTLSALARSLRIWGHQREKPVATKQFHTQLCEDHHHQPSSSVYVKICVRTITIPSQSDAKIANPSHGEDQQTLKDHITGWTSSFRCNGIFSVGQNKILKKRYINKFNSMQVKTETINRLVTSATVIIILTKCTYLQLCGLLANRLQQDCGVFLLECRCKPRRQIRRPRNWLWLQKVKISMIGPIWPQTNSGCKRCSHCNIWKNKVQVLLQNAIYFYSLNVSALSHIFRFVLVCYWNEIDQCKYLVYILTAEHFKTYV